jgi:hypothetical protein
LCERGGCSYAGAEGVADEYGAHNVEPPLEALEELKPVGHRVRAAPLAVAERRQVESEGAVTGSGEKRANLVPDPRRLGSAAKQHEWRAAVAPSAVGHERPVDPDERPAIEQVGWPLVAVGCQVEPERRERESHHKHEQRQRKPAAPTTEPTPPGRAILDPAHIKPQPAIGLKRVSFCAE